MSRFLEMLRIAAGGRPAVPPFREPNKAPAGPPQEAAPVVQHSPRAAGLLRALADNDSEPYSFRTDSDVWYAYVASSVEAFRQRMRQAREKQAACNVYNRKADMVPTERARVLIGRGWGAAYDCFYRTLSYHSRYSVYKEYEKALAKLNDPVERAWWEAELLIAEMRSRDPQVKRDAEVQRILDASPFEGENKR